ncbi:MAG: FAD-dependent oxidoreductase [Lapillicoccus sp.]
MRVAVIGAGPAGLMLGAGLARRGATVTLFDRDPGPPEQGVWPRKGVMQFHHAHAIRPQVVSTAQREAPGAMARLLAAGAEPVTIPLPGGGVLPAGLRCRRSTFEAALRAEVEQYPGIDLRRGHVDAVRVDGAGAGARAAGVVVDGIAVDADLVVDASGRAGRVSRGLRAPQSAGGVCGIAYVDRQYQLHPGAGPGPLVNPLAWQGNFDGYQCLIFTHERGIFSVLLVRPSDRRDLVDLRFESGFDAAARAIPGLSDWTHPDRSRPITSVLPGGTMLNAYRSQRGPDGSLALPGLVFVGDAVCTTTPNFGRGLATTMLQVDELLRLLEVHTDPSDTPQPADLVAVGEAFDTWTEAMMRPWVEDHGVMDESLRRRWAGEDIDPSGPIPSNLIMEAAAVDPRIQPVIGPYVAMLALPTSLQAVEPYARAVYAGGWRPPYSDGPTRAELARVVAGAVT